MELQVLGKLKTETAEQPSFRGFRIKASFGRKPVPAPSPPSTSGPIPAEVIEMVQRPIEQLRHWMHPAAEAPIPDLVSAESDDAGNFTLVLPDKHEIATEKVKFTVWSPVGRIIGELEVLTADLGKGITIKVETFNAGPSDKLTPKVDTPQSVAVDALFSTDAALRRAITENLKSLGGESEAVAARVERAWKFNPSQRSPDEPARRHYVAPGSNPGEVLRTVIMSGVGALRSAKTERVLTLRNSAELEKLIKSKPEGRESPDRVVELGPLIEFIQRRGTGPIQSAELNSTRYRAEAQAEDILGVIKNGGRDKDGDRDKDGAPGARQGLNVVRTGQALTSDAPEAEELVKDKVNIQMKSATAPESQVLDYARLPNSADEDKAQKTILQSFEVREGPTDVTSYHDFHTLQIAFQHVWTEIFDGQLASLGRDLYIEYVKLKDFTGSTAPDMQVGTFADLKRLMEEIRKLSQFVDETIPASLRPPGSDQAKSGLPSPTPEDGARGAGVLASGGASLFIEWAFNELIKAGNRPVRVTWNEFPLKLNEGRGNIIELRPAEQNAQPPGTVEIVLETDADSYKKKVSFQQWDRDTQRPIYSADLQNFGGGHGPIDRLVLNAAQVQTGTLKFVSEDEIVNELLLGRYVLGDLGERLTERTRLTFRWKGQR